MIKKISAVLCILMFGVGIFGMLLPPASASIENYEFSSNSLTTIPGIYVDWSFDHEIDTEFEPEEVYEYEEEWVWCNNGTEDTYVFLNITWDYIEDYSYEDYYFWLNIFQDEDGTMFGDWTEDDWTEFEDDLNGTEGAMEPEGSQYSEGEDDIWTDTTYWDDYSISGDEVFWTVDFMFQTYNQSIDGSINATWYMMWWDDTSQDYIIGEQIDPATLTAAIDEEEDWEYYSQWANNRTYSGDEYSWTYFTYGISQYGSYWNESGSSWFSIDTEFTGHNVFDDKNANGILDMSYYWDADTYEFISNLTENELSYSLLLQEVYNLELVEPVETEDGFKFTIALDNLTYYALNSSYDYETGLLDDQGFEVVCDYENITFDYITSDEGGMMSVKHDIGEWTDIIGAEVVEFTDMGITLEYLSWIQSSATEYIYNSEEELEWEDYTDPESLEDETEFDSYLYEEILNLTVEEKELLAINFTGTYEWDNTEIHPMLPILTPIWAYAESEVSTMPGYSDSWVSMGRENYYTICLAVWSGKRIVMDPTFMTFNSFFDPNRFGGGDIPGFEGILLVITTSTVISVIIIRRKMRFFK